MRNRRLLRWLAPALAVVMLAALGQAPAGAGKAKGKDKPPAVDFTLTVLHFNDGESDLLGDEDGAGSISRFGTLLDELRTDAVAKEIPGKAKGRDKPNPGKAKGKTDKDEGVITLTSGDNFLAGTELAAGFANERFYDVIALDHLDIDAFTIGNHEFDFGPGVLADFIGQFEDNPAPFLTANLDFSLEPELAALVDDGRIAASTIVEERGERIGIVGATTPDLEEVSSPGRTIIDPDVAAAVQTEVDALTAQGIDKILLSSHLQAIQNELDLVALLSDVDAVIGGGGGEDIRDSYPLVATDADGRTVPVVTVPGDYFDIGRLVLSFDDDGEVVDFGGSLEAVTGDLAEDPFLRSEVEVPVEDFVADLDATVLATSEVGLNGVRSQVRTRETNVGNLLADSQLAAARDRAAAFGVPEADIALQNGGGIRNDSVIDDGEVTLLDTFDIAPFSNFVAVLPDVDRADVVAAIEHGLEGLPAAAGSFAQWAGLEITYDPSAPPLDRVVDVTLDDGTSIVVGGVLQPGAPLTIATIDFLAAGNDGYDMFETYDFVRIGLSYQKALADLVSDLGVVTAANYADPVLPAERTRIIPV